jgi:hypothetical protein
MKYIGSSAFINVHLTKLWLVRTRAGRKIGLGGVMQDVTKIM